MEQELAKINTAIEIINSDKLQRNSITPDLIERIANQYDYACQKITNLLSKLCIMRYLMKLIFLTSLL